jgi:hypothetical protein
MLIMGGIGLAVALRLLRKNGALVGATVKLGRSPDDLELRGPPFNARSIQQRVRLLGAAVGLQSLSPHDCRHC